MPPPPLPEQLTIWLAYHSGQMVYINHNVSVTCYHLCVGHSYKSTLHTTTGIQNTNSYKHGQNNTQSRKQQR